MICTSKLIGDVNGDGIVDQADADLLFNWVSYPNERETTYKLTCPENADVTGNGSVNIGDATLLMNHVAYPYDPAYALAQPEPEHLTGYIEPPHTPGEPGILIPTDEPYDEPYDAVIITDEPYDDYIPPPEEPPEKDKSLMYIILAIILGAFAFLLG